MVLKSFLSCFNSLSLLSVVLKFATSGPVKFKFYFQISRSIRFFSFYYYLYRVKVDTFKWNKNYRRISVFVFSSISLFLQLRNAASSLTVPASEAATEVCCFLSSHSGSIPCEQVLRELDAPCPWHSDHRGILEAWWSWATLADAQLRGQALPTHWRHTECCWHLVDRCCSKTFSRGTGRPQDYPAQSLPVWLTLTALEGCFASASRLGSPACGHSQFSPWGPQGGTGSLTAGFNEGGCIFRPAWKASASSLKASLLSHPATKGPACSWWCLWGEHRALSRDSRVPQGEGHLCCPGPCRLGQGLEQEQGRGAG